jgi:hypothetical protein
MRMANEPVKNESVRQQSDAETDRGTDRRTFIAVASTGMIAGAAALASSAGGAQSAANQGAGPGAGEGIAGAMEVPRPAGLGPRAMMDNRFPATFSESVPKACQVIVAYFTALSQRDLKGMADYVHFPFVTFEGVEAVRVNTADELLSKAPPSMNMSMNPERFTDHDSYLKPGCYDVFTGFEVLCMDPVCVGISMSYDRYGSDGKLLARCDGVYSITNNDGRWAIQMISTIFTPAMMIGIVYPDAINAANRIRMDGDLAFQLADRSVAPAPQAGTSAMFINYSGQPWTLGPNGHAMDQFKIAGVKSRMYFSDGTTPAYPASLTSTFDAATYYKDYRKLFVDNGVGGFGWVYGVLPISRILHQTVNKVHQFTGAVRFNQAGEEASYNTDIGIITYKKGRWGTSGMVCYTTPHDRSNDVLRA